MLKTYPKDVVVIKDGKLLLDTLGMKIIRIVEWKSCTSVYRVEPRYPTNIVIQSERSNETLPEIEGSPSWNSLEDEPVEESFLEKELKTMRTKL